MVYARTFDDATLDFGVLGVHEGTLVMYDRQTESRWSQLFGEAVDGPMKGRRLEKLPSVMTSWGEWRRRHPDTTVYVKKSTPYDRRFTRETFRRIASMEEGPVRANDLVLGVEGHVEARAYLVRRLAKRRLVEDTLEATPIAVYLAPDLATARVWDRRIDARVLSFVLTDGEKLRDAETASLWDPVTGEAVEGPLRGAKLAPLVSTFAVWFAWKKYRPDTVIDGEPR